MPEFANVRILPNTYDPGWVSEVDAEIVNVNTTKTLASANVSLVVVDAAGRPARRRQGLLVLAASVGVALRLNGANGVPSIPLGRGRRRAQRTPHRATRLIALEEVLPAGELDGSPAWRSATPSPASHAADDREASGLGNRGEQLEVLAEAEVVRARARGERHAVEVDHAADSPSARARWPASAARPSEMSSIAWRRAASRAPFGEPQRRARGTRSRAEREPARAERAGDDEHVAGPRARAAGDALRAADRGDGEHDVGAAVVSPPTTGTPVSAMPS